MSMRALQVIPILRIFSIEKAREFYLDYAGFHLDWEHRFDATAPLYMQVSRDGLVLHLSEHYGDGSPGTRFQVTYEGFVSSTPSYVRRTTPTGVPALRKLSGALSS